MLNNFNNLIGIGIVNALEIIQAFPMKKEQGGPINGLHVFKNWLDGFDIFADINKSLMKSSQSSDSVEDSKTPLVRIYDCVYGPPEHLFAVFALHHRYQK